MPDIPNIDIRPDHWEIVKSILQKHVPQYEVWAFGSRAKWTAKEYSDLDLAIITDEPLSLDVSARLSDAFSESDLPWRVDVVDWAATSESFKKDVERDKVVVQEGKKGWGVVGEWSRTTVGEVASRVTKGTTPTTLGGRFVESGVVFVKVEAITDDGRFQPEKFAFIDQETHRLLERSRLQGDDVLFTIAGTIGRVAKVDAHILPANTNQAVAIIRPNRSLVEPNFLFYALRDRDRVRDAQTRIVQSVQANFSLSELASIDLPLPPIREQRAIAHILGTLDDKIELNRKQNETLEAMASALFKAWFVDFEPVRAKMEGRWQRGQSLPGLPAHLYDLFPDRFVESELGEIPEGWEMRSLDSIANYLNGLALQKFPPENDDEFLPVIKIAQLRAGNTKGADRASARIKPEYVVVDGDILFSWSGSLEVEVWNGGRGALNQHLFKVTSNKVPKWFYFFATRHHLPRFRAIAADKATTMGHIQRKHLNEARIAVAPPESLKVFDGVLAPLFDQIVSNAQESRTLAQLRDTLLPKLISGELRVKDAEAFLKERGL
ncbi:restriction endonuclease subunit S [Tepidimonas taiwanensis]|uniref:Type I restriction modification DNA specificity domain protein n=1 Tax=Tepidimonas taiwanensis TaxID=307486 RepID=A0A554X124_9BURK|nr:restriction endonuclease subunit S [Tepidimonas taiwanensis]TSE29530.1 Type I restriction modification DNA specificity domain protein [Tepidimonas taiwanensis]UBQ05124.1 restriction endonuclease subunit S [Tepidimonas taiwanensis]